MHLPIPSRHRDYDRTARDPEAKRFYSSWAWVTLRLSKLREHPLCEMCEAKGLLVPASIVHHRAERTVSPDLELDWDNLQSLCAPCHSALHAKA